MPLTESGKKVLEDMRRRYGRDKGEQVFYATMNQRNMREKWEHKKRKKSENRR